SMRREYLSFLSASFCGLLACLLLVGCSSKKHGNDDDDDDDVRPVKKGSTGKGGAVGGGPKKQLVKGGYDGVLKGVVKWSGDNAKIETARENLLKAMVNDKSYCTTGKLPSDPADF